jgi:hypothetical protein
MCKKRSSLHAFGLARWLMPNLVIVALTQLISREQHTANRVLSDLHG